MPLPLPDLRNVRADLPNFRRTGAKSGVLSIINASTGAAAEVGPNQLDRIGTKLGQSPATHLNIQGGDWHRHGGLLRGSHGSLHRNQGQVTMRRNLPQPANGEVVQRALAFEQGERPPFGLALS